MCEVCGESKAWKAAVVHGDSTIDCQLMPGLEEGLWGQVPKWEPNTEAERVCPSLQVWDEQAGWEQASVCCPGARVTAGSSSLNGRLLGHRLSCWREEKELEARAGLVEISGEETAAGERRVCSYHKWSGLNRFRWMWAGPPREQKPSVPSMGWVRFYLYVHTETL